MMLSFLKLVKNWPKNAVQNLVVSCGAIWCHREKPQYRCTTTIPLVHNSGKDVLENLLPIWLLVPRNLFIPSHFWTIYTNFDNCCQRYIEKIWKTLLKNWNRCRINCRSTFSALNYPSGFFSSNRSAIFSINFWTFRNSWPQFSEHCGTTWQSKWAFHSAPEMAIIFEKKWRKQHQNRPINYDTILVHSMSPKCSRPNVTKNTIFSHLQPVHVVPSPQTLHGDRGRHAHSRR